MSVDAYYLELGAGRVRATDATVGPWDPRLQHGSPPVALLARTIERSLPRDDARIARLTCDFAGPVPVGELALTASVERAGARIERSRARLLAGERTVLEVSAWRIAVGPERSPAVPWPGAVPRLPGPQAPQRFVDVAPFGYGDSLEWRFAEGSFSELGPAAVWTRPRLPLFAGEPLSALCRLLLMVDSANGVSAELPPARYVFVPVELTVSVARHPRTEWVGMRARTSLEPDGIGLTHAELYDEEGPLGFAVQTLFVAPR
ncbi:MAG: thioesterase family protein [Polyangiaceae bacterium]|nr:thioesterase family protein [Polyangiaceae bacterium]